MRRDRTLLPAVMMVEALAFFIGAYLHTGADIVLNGGAIDEPRIIAATIVETICGVALLAGGALLAGRFRDGRGWAMSAHGVAIGGVLLGMITLAFDLGPRTRLNDVFHIVVLTVLLLGLLRLVWLAGRFHGANRRPD